MDEDKKGLVGQAADAAKQEAKKKVKNKILAKILPYLLPAIGTILIVLLIVGLISLIVTTIVGSIKSFLGFDSDSTTTVEQDARGAIYLSDDGKNYKINEEYIDNIINTLQSQAVDTDEAGLTYSEEDSKDENNNIKESMIKKYVKTEVKTLFPKIGSSGIDGLITVKRDSGSENGNSKKLTYIPYSDLKKKVEENDKKAEDYFSLNPETWKLCYASTEITETYDQNGDKISETEFAIMNEVDYQYLVEPYAMPSNFTVSTHFIAQDEDFMNDILNLVERDSEIILTLKDTVSTTTTTVDYSGKVYEKLNETAYYTKSTTVNDSATQTTPPETTGSGVFETTSSTSPTVDLDEFAGSHVETSTGEVSVDIYNEYEVNNKNVYTYYNEIKDFKTVITSKSTELVVTKADTWIANKVDEYEKTIEKTEQDPVTEKIQKPEAEDEYNKISEQKIDNLNGYLVHPQLQQAVNEQAGDGSTVTINNINIETYRRLDITETTNESLEYTVYNSINKETNLDNVQKIIDLINEKKYSKVKNNLITSAELYFYLLNQDEKTQDIEEVMRYVLYKLTGKDYGVTDLDDLTSNYESTSFSATPGGAGDYIVKIDAAGAAPTASSKDDLKQGLLKWSPLKVNSKAKDNALRVLDTVWDCQENYKVNAIFIYSFLMQETTMGTANTNYVNVDNNWGSWNLGHTYSSPEENIKTIANGFANGSIYFKNGLISVSQIGHKYCPNMPEYPTQGDNWVEKVSGNMATIYQCLGISVESGDSSGNYDSSNTGDVSAGGTGTIGVYTSSSGRKFNLYLQGSPAPWANNDYGDSRNMGKAGCGPTAAAIIASGYNSSTNPEHFRSYLVNKYGIGNHSSASYITGGFDQLGINVSHSVGSVNKDRIIKCLKNGGQVWAVVQNCKYTSGAHCIALIDYKLGDMVYVAHGTAKSRPYGWDSLDYILKYNKYDQILYVGE